MDLQKEFVDFISKNKLFTPSSKILLAVSGGIDSMVMLHLFISCGYRNIAIVHCNFQLRAEESFRDEMFVIDTAINKRISCYTQRFKTEEEMKRTGESVEMAARRLRYQWFEELCQEKGFEYIAVAHHLNDSIETFFINLLRGTGLRGLLGISSRTGRIRRPLLFARRGDILEYAEKYKIPYREDLSNRTLKFLRNRFRLKILPALRKISTGFYLTMWENMRRLSTTQQFIDTAIGKMYKYVLTHEKDVDIFWTDRIDSEYSMEFVLYEMLNSMYGFKWNMVKDMCNSIRNGETGKKFSFGPFIAYTDRGRILVVQTREDDMEEVEIHKWQSQISLHDFTICMEEKTVEDYSSFVVSKNQALLDLDTLSFPLCLRRWEPGDVFIPFGMTGKKKVGDFLTDIKMSPVDRLHQFVLLSSNQIVWVVGERTDERFRVRPRITKHVLSLTVVK